MSPASTIPAHVDPALVRDFDFYHVAGDVQDPQLAWCRLQEGPRIFYTPRHGGHWVVTRGEDIATCLRDHTRFSSFPGAIPRELAGASRIPPLAFDPPEHGAYRAPLLGLFSPQAVAAMEQDVRALTVELIEGFRARGRCDFAKDFAFSMPVEVFMRLAGLPASDREFLMDCVEHRMRNTDTAAALAATEKLVAYVAHTVMARRAAPRGDILSHIARAEVDIDGGRVLSVEELVAMGYLLFLAGLDTVASTLTFIARFLATHPGHVEQLRKNPGLTFRAVEEMIRRHGVPNLTRSVVSDMEYQGVFMQKGDLVLVPVAMHGLDPAQFADPLAVNFDRQGPHAGFGLGPHRCIGSHLARLEVRVFLEEWLTRIGGFELAPGVEASGASGAVLCFHSLPLVWHPGAAGQ